jgi:hypothetical protein
MTFKRILAALALGAAASGAGAAVLTFDALTDLVYGDTAPLLGSMSYSAEGLNYVEGGFRLTLHAPNAAFGAAHISDGSFQPQTYNWHDGLENGWGTYLTVRRVGGGLFDLTGFDYDVEWSAVYADGVAVAPIQGAGSWNTALQGISELRIGAGAWNQIDNLALQEAAVPLPGTVFLLLGGLAAGGAVRRSRGARPHRA